MKYEFVDTDLGGHNWKGKERSANSHDIPTTQLCSRVFRKKRGKVHSPNNVFLHGRGGAKNISCLYRFEGNADDRV